MNARNLDDSQAPTQITAAEKAAFLAHPAIVPTAASLTLTQIMSQKYIAQWAWGHNELWMDMRRYHYTDIDPASGSQVFRASRRRRTSIRTTAASSCSASGRGTTRSTSGTLRAWTRSADRRATITPNRSGSPYRNRHMNRFILAALLCAACSQRAAKDPVQDITGAPPARSRVKFFNFGVNAPSVNFYANDTEDDGDRNSTNGVEATTGVAYGGVGSGGFYAAIAPGPYTLTGKIAATTDKDLSISPLAATIEDGKYYSYYMSGIYNTTTKTVDAFVVEDPVVAPTDFSVATSDSSTRSRTRTR